MLNISKYHKLIVGCGAIATASIGGFVQFADAAGTQNQTAQSSPSNTLIANNPPQYGSNNGGVGLPGGINGSNNGGYGRGNYFYDSNNGGKGDQGYYRGKGYYYYDSNNGGAAPEGNKDGRYYYYDYKDSNNGGKGLGYYYYDSNNGGIGPKGPAYYYGDGPKGMGYYNYSNDGSGNYTPPTPPVVPPVVPPVIQPPVVVINPNVQQGSDAGGNNSASLNGSNGTGNFARGASLISTARGAAISKGIGIAQGKYDAALAALAAAEAATPNTSSKTSPVRYGREPGDVASCGCPNADTTTAGTTSQELVAAKAAEAEAAAELASVKAEARKFLESVKNGEFGGSGSSSPIW